jgi:beta-mannosidase
LYHYDLEPNASLFATSKACEPLHVMLNEKEGYVQVINATSKSLSNALAGLAVYGLDGKKIYESLTGVTAAAGQATNIKNLSVPKDIHSVHFIRLQLLDVSHKVISSNFYWKGAPGNENIMTALDSMQLATLQATASKKTEGNKIILEVVLNNPSSVPAVMAHIQLRRIGSNERVLPVFYSDNYVSILPGESTTISIEASLADLNGQQPAILLDGLNIAVKETNSNGVVIKLNENAQVSKWPVTGLPFSPFNIGSR